MLCHFQNVHGNDFTLPCDVNSSMGWLQVVSLERSSKVTALAEELGINEVKTFYKGKTGNSI